MQAGWTLGLIGLPWVSMAALQTATRPNFVIFFADDWGWGDLGANWPATEGFTPHLDAVAAQGVRLTDMHTGSSVCGPSRAAIMTGRLGLRQGMTHNLGGTALHGLPRNETTLAEYLHDGGYATGMIGKWHLGMLDGHQPNRRGFDSWFGVPSSIDVGCGATPTISMAPMNPEHTSFCPACQRNPACPSDPSCGRAEGCVGQDLGVGLYANSTIIEQPVNMDLLSAKYKDEASRFLSVAAQAASPFFLYYAAAHMHVPQNHDAQWTPAGGTKGPFGAALREMDDEVGHVVSVLDGLGLSNNTLLLVVGDNGPWECKCNLTGVPGPYQGLWQKTEGGGGASGKFTMWEGGHRVPGIARWPTTIKPGVSAALASTMDFVPTLLSLAGIPLPTSVSFDGLDLSSALLDGAPEVHEYLFHPASGACADGDLLSMRMGHFKAHWVTGGIPTCGGVQAKCMPRPDASPLLFDLSSDPAESTALDTNLPQYASIVTKMLSIRGDTLRDIASTPRSVVDFSRGDAARIALCCDPDAADGACGCPSSLPFHVQLLDLPHVPVLSALNEQGNGRCSAGMFCSNGAFAPAFNGSEAGLLVVVRNATTSSKTGGAGIAKLAWASRSSATAGHEQSSFTDVTLEDIVLEDAQNPRLALDTGTQTWYLTYKQSTLTNQLESPKLQLASSTSTPQDPSAWRLLGPVLPNYTNRTGGGSLLLSASPSTQPHLLFFSDTNTSSVRVASAVHPAGPWNVSDEMLLEPRPGYFDANGTAPGGVPLPIGADADTFILFYTGEGPTAAATRAGCVEESVLSSGVGYVIFTYASSSSSSSSSPPTNITMNILQRSAIPLLTPSSIGNYAEGRAPSPCLTPNTISVNGVEVIAASSSSASTASSTYRIFLGGAGATQGEAVVSITSV